MLPKFMPDLFQPITLPAIKLARRWHARTRARIRIGYRVNRSVQHGARPANDN